MPCFASGKKKSQTFIPDKYVLTQVSKSIVVYKYLEIIFFTMK